MIISIAVGTLYLNDQDFVGFNIILALIYFDEKHIKF
jgi:hypothetical protein